MYYDYFGLKQPPFRITPDTSLFYPGGDRGAVLDALVYAILNGEGMVKVVGEVGSGKTMLCRMLEKELPDKVEVVYLANPSLSPENILHAIAFELKLPVQPDTSRLQVMHNLQEYLLERHAENRQVVVFVEEAQAMPIATLEEIRLLSNLETQTSKLLQIALFGQPELDELISRPEIRQLKERITYSFQLNPFVSEHIRDYVNTRLRASGYRAGEIFDKGAIRKIEHYSKGLLRRVNILADKSMLAAYAANTNKVTAKHVKQAARDSEFVMYRRSMLWMTLIAASILLVIIASVALWQKTPSNSGLISEQTLSSDDATVEAGTESMDPEMARGAGIPEGKDATGLADTKKLVSTNKQMKSALGANTKTLKLNEDKSYNTNAYEQASKEIELSLDDPIKDAPLKDSSEETPTKMASEEKQDSLTGAERQQLMTPPESEILEGKMLDLSTLFELQDQGDPRLSTQESALLRKQLRDLPPEVALYQDSAQFSDICKLCWSILYRPITEPENL
ncbi:MAG: MSHA biogenesis protein MshM [Gammaproteobacteria bacterium]|jgi:MSHA biogenesis protein MshM